MNILPLLIPALQLLVQLLPVGTAFFAEAKSLLITLKARHEAGETMTVEDVKNVIEDIRKTNDEIQDA